MLADIETTHPTWGTGFWALNSDTVANTLIVCAVFVVIALVARRGLARARGGRPDGMVNFLETIIDFINGIVRDTLGARPVPAIAPIAISMFAFVIMCNWLGLIPTRKSPTNDVNTAFALALFSVVLLHTMSVRFRGAAGYVSHYFSVVTPSWRNPLGALARIGFGLLEILQEVAKPLTLSFRLYFNIFVGELMLGLIILLADFLESKGVIGWAGAGLWAALVGPIWVGFSIFVGAVQAFIFTMLTISYVAQATETHDDTGHGPDHPAPGTASLAAH